MSTLMIAILFLAAVLSAQVNAEVSTIANLSAKKWFADWKARNPRIRTKSMASVIVVRMSKDGQFSPEALNSTDANLTSFLISPTASEITLVSELNRNGSTIACNRTRVTVAKCFEVGLVLDVSEKTWKLFTIEAPNFKEKLLAKAPGLEDKNYSNWLRKVLNYDGIVLDQRDDLLLAIVPNHESVDQFQGLVMGDSATQQKINERSSKGLSLVHLLVRDGRLGIFKNILTEDSTQSTQIPPFSKLILEQKKSAPEEKEEEQ